MLLQVLEVEVRVLYLRFGSMDSCSYDTPILGH